MHTRKVARIAASLALLAVLTACGGGGGGGSTSSSGGAASSQVGGAAGSASKILNEAYYTYNTSSSGGLGFASRSGQSGFAIDALGNVWMTSLNGPLASDDLFEVTPSAASDCSSGCQAYTAPSLLGADQALAIDQKGDVFVSSVIDATLGEYIQAGTPVQCSTNGGYTASEVSDTTQAISVNKAGLVFLGGVKGVWSLSSALPDAHGNCTGTLAVTYPASVATNGYPPEAMGIDSAGNVWAAIPSSSGNSEYIFRNNSLFLTEHSRLTGVTSLAIDGSGNVWLAFTGTNAAGTGAAGFVLKIDATATANCASGCTTFNSPYFSSGLASYIGNPEPGAVAIDGAGTAWVLANGYNVVVAITPTAAADCSSGCHVYQASITSSGTPTIDGSWLAVDGSGNVWMSGDNLSGSGGLVEALKLAAATATPLAAQTR